jgi:hypothetical protein
MEELEQEVEQDVSEAVEPATETEDVTEDAPGSSEEHTQAVAKTFTQDELDAIVAKRLAREQRKWERGSAPQQAPKQAALSIDQFESPEAYAEALADQKIKARDQQAQHSQIIEQYHDREEEARSKYEDFEQVAYNPAIKISDSMAHTIQASDNGPDVAYFLGKNPKEADRIYKLPPLLQAREIGRIEASLTLRPVPKKQSAAPAPITPIGGKTGGTKNPADMSDDEYRKWRRTRSK